MKKNIRFFTLIVLSCALCFCIVMMIRSYLAEREGEIIYEEAVDEFIITAPAAMVPTQPTTRPQDTQPGETTTATEPQETEPPATTTTAPVVTRPIINNAEEVQVDFQRLQAVNPDVLGWVIIENTTISYPILQGRDNEYYLTKTYNNKSSSYGSIFVDYRLSSGFNIPHTVIYGHNMRNSAMFGQLLKYSNQSFWQQRKYFHILLPDGILKYEIFSAYKADVDSETYRVSFADADGKRAWLDTIVAWSDVAMGVTPQSSDDIVTLSTCTSNTAEKHDYRYVVHGRLVMDTRNTQNADEGGE